MNIFKQSLAIVVVLFGINLADHTPTDFDILFPFPLGPANRYSILRDGDLLMRIQSVENEVSTSVHPIRKLLILARLSEFFQHEYYNLIDQYGADGPSDPLSDYDFGLNPLDDSDVALNYYAHLYDLAHDHQSESSDDSDDSDDDSVDDEQDFGLLTPIFYNDDGSERNNTSIYDTVHDAIRRVYDHVGDHYWGPDHNEAQRELFELHDTDLNFQLDEDETAELFESLADLQDGHWGYAKHNGPKLWPYVNEYCDNSIHKKQSPVSISYSNLIRNSVSNCHDNNGHDLNWEIKDYLFENQGYHWKIDFNDHHSWKITPVDSNGNDANDAAHCVMELTNVHGAGTYCLAQAHVHYGRDEDEGSEHVIHGEHFPIEMHFVHFRSDYPDLAAALDDWENLQTQDQDHYVLSVVGVMYEISDDSTFENEALHKILQADGSHYLFDSFDIHDLIPNGPTNEFYSYQGSLTTPPCYPNVNWVVLKDKEKISSTEMAHIHEFTHHTSIARHPHLNTNPVYECNAIDIDGL